MQSVMFSEERYSLLHLSAYIMFETNKFMCTSSVETHAYGAVNVAAGQQNVRTMDDIET